MIDEPPRSVRVGLVALAVLPVVVAVARALRADWFPIGDDALLYIRVRDVMTQHHPLLGSWSSASLSLGTDVNNPGPLYDDLAAAFARLGSTGQGAAFGAAAINIAAIVGTSAAARHIGGWRVQRWFLLAVAALSWTMGSELLFDIWQAHALLLPFLFCSTLLIGIAGGRFRCVPWAVFTVSLLVQTHISYAYILGVLTATAIALAWFGKGDEGGRVDRARVSAALRSRTAIGSFVVFVVVWAQTLVEQFFGEGQGNLSRLVSNVGGGDVTLGFANATKIAAAVVVLPPWWLRSGFSSTVPSTRLTDTADGVEVRVAGLPHLAVAVCAVIALVVALVVIGRALARRSRRVTAHAAWFSATGVVATVGCLGLLTVGRVGLAAHHVRWLWALAVVVHTVLAWAITTLAADLRRERRATSGSETARPDRWGFDRVLSIALVTLLVVFVGLSLPRHAQQEGPVADVAAMPALRQVFHELGSPELRGALEDAQPVVYETANLRVFEPYSSAVMMRLQELGIEFRVTDEGMVRQLGNGRRASGAEAASLMQLEGSEALLHDGPECRLATGDRLTDAERLAAGSVADLLVNGLSDGTVSVDASQLTGDDVSAYETALIDTASASRLVYEGQVSRWLLDGDAEIAAPGLAALDVVLADVAEPAGARSGSDVGAVHPTTLAAVGLVDEWVISTYAVFGTGAVCPT